MVCRKKERLLGAEILLGLFVCLFFQPYRIEDSEQSIDIQYCVDRRKDEQDALRAFIPDTILAVGQKIEESSITRYFGTVKTTEMAIDLQQ